MSMLPFLFDLTGDPVEDVFGYGLYPEQFRHPQLRRQHCLMNSNCWPNIYRRQWSVPQQKERLNQPSNLTKSSIGKDGFQVCVDVQHFQPNEITVKTVENSVVVEGKHEEKEDDHGHIYRHFVRRYQLPKEFDIKDVVSTLSSDGVLTIKAPPKAHAIESNERVIQIQQTGPAHLSIKSNEQKEKEAGDKAAGEKEAGEKMAE